MAQGKNYFFRVEFVSLNIDLCFISTIELLTLSYNIAGGRRGRDRMVVGFITTYAISAYYH
jgi:hypothetical protein